MTVSRLDGSVGASCETDMCRASGPQGQRDVEQSDGLHLSAVGAMSPVQQSTLGGFVLVLRCPHASHAIVG